MTLVPSSFVNDSIICFTELHGVTLRNQDRDFAGVGTRDTNNQMAVFLLTKGVEYDISGYRYSANETTWLEFLSKFGYNADTDYCQMTADKAEDYRIRALNMGMVLENYYPNGTVSTIYPEQLVKRDSKTNCITRSCNSDSDCPESSSDDSCRYCNEFDVFTNLCEWVTVNTMDGRIEDCVYYYLSNIQRVKCYY